MQAVVVRLGANGQLLVDRLDNAPEMVTAAGLVNPLPLTRLSPRERETLTLLGAGLTYRETAGALGCRWRTVSTHGDSILSKLHTGNMTTTALWALLAGMHTPGQIIEVWRQHRPHLVGD